MLNEVLNTCAHIELAIIQFVSLRKDLNAFLCVFCQRMQDDLK